MSIGRHTTYNFLGGVVPIAVSLIVVPLYLGLIGAERYGVLALAWLLFGYFNIFDLGLSKAVAQRIAAQRDSSPEARATTFWSALVVNAATGVIGGIVLYLLAQLVLGRFVRVDGALLAELLQSVPILAAAVPLGTIGGALSGSLRGRERFLELNVISSLSSVLGQVAPLVTAWLMGPHLAPLILSSIFASLISVAVQWLVCRRHVTGGRRIRVERGAVIALLGFGGWVSVSAIVGPLMIVLDRFVIGAVLGAVAVTIYTIPWQLTQRLLLLPSSLQSALFPRQAAAAPDEQGRLTVAGLRAVAAVTTPLVVGGIFLMEPFLKLWLGDALPLEPMGDVGRVALLGFWSTGLASVLFSQIEARGDVRISALVHVLELPFYLGALYLLMNWFGLVGAAAAFTLRCLADAVIFNRIALRSAASYRVPAAMTALLVACIAAADWLPSGGLLWWLSFAVTLLVAVAASYLHAPEPLRELVQRRLPVGLRGSRA